MTENSTYGIIPDEQAHAILKRIGSLVKTHRQQRQWSMAQLAEKAGTSSSMISDLENNKGKVPSMFTLMSIARALNIPDDSFVKIFWSFNKAPIQLDKSAETAISELLLGFHVPTNTIDDIMILLNIIKTIGHMYQIKNSKTQIEGLTIEDKSFEYANALIDLYSQYDHKSKNK